MRRDIVTDEAELEYNPGFPDEPVPGLDPEPPTFPKPPGPPEAPAPPVPPAPSLPPLGVVVLAVPVAEVVVVDEAELVSELVVVVVLEKEDKLIAEDEVVDTNDDVVGLAGQSSKFVLASLPSGPAQNSWQSPRSRASGAVLTIVSPPVHLPLQKICQPSGKHCWSP
jgi:hypothetical protein